MIQINKPPHQRILELGGGEHPNPASDVRVDIRPIEGKVDWVQDFENEPLRCQSGEFDCVYSHFCLEHVSYTKLPALLKEIHRVLKPNGKVLIAVPNTLKQIEWLLSHPEGWDGKDFFTASSELLFGSQTYDANAHKCFFTPEALAKLFREAGFDHVRTTAYGERSTDMVLDAVKLAPGSTSSTTQSTTPTTVSTTAPITPLTEDAVVQATESLNALMGSKDTSQSPAPTSIASLTREEMFDKHYFNGGGKVGGYAREGYWDYPVHNITAQHVRVRRPQSVLEIGCGRGYILKRLQDWGIPVCGLEISRHAWMTRVIDPILNIDICTERWPIEDQAFDMSFSMATFEHIPEQYIAHVLSELRRTCKSHLHGIDFGQHDDGFDKTHVSLLPPTTWVQKFHEAGLTNFEILDKESLERGDMPQEVFADDGKIKLAVGTFTVMSHYGWQNIDVHDLMGFAQTHGYRYHRIDARNGLPWKTSEVSLISCSHMLEHLSYREGLGLLREFRRLIKPDGAVRVAVPNAQLLLEHYERRTLDEFIPISDGVENATTQMQKLWALLNEGHQATYDRETLCQQFEDAGFVPTVAAFRSCLQHPGSRQILRETLDMHPSLSLYVDAVPKVV